MKRLVSILALLSALAVRADAATASSVTRHGVTWTFSESKTVGTYCNGDPWVVGPVTITGISPGWNGQRNGTQINPYGGSSLNGSAYRKQGYDTRAVKQVNGSDLMAYDASINVGIGIAAGTPLAVPVGSSVVSALGGDYPNDIYVCIQHYSILTVVTSAPAADAFRPPFIAGATKTSRWKESDMNYARLNSLDKTQVSFMHTLSEVTEKFSKPWYLHTVNVNGEIYTRPANQWFVSEYAPGNASSVGYSLYMADVEAHAGMMLNLDYSNSQKRDLLVGIVQAGIDVWGLVSQHSYYGDGGHTHGRSICPAIAGAVLNDSDILSVVNGANQLFPIFFSTYFIDASRAVGYPNPYNESIYCGGPKCSGPAFPWSDTSQGQGNSHGVAFYGYDHKNWYQADNNTWLENSGNDYIGIITSTFAAPAAVFRVMGLRTNVNWEPLFLFVERMRTEKNWNGGDWATTTSAGVIDFYTTFKDSGLVPGGPDTNAPVIANVYAVTNATSAEFRWGTDEGSTSGLEYGLTTGYGASATNSTLTSVHSLSASNLTAGTLYHYRVISTDLSNNVAVSGDYTFFTDITNRVSAPVLPGGFSSLTNINITITCATDGASVYYTLDGSTPDSGDALYSGTFLLTNSATIKAVALKAAWTNSAVVSASYEVFGIPSPDPSVPVTSLGAWFMGSSALTNNGGVTTWYDVSANARHATAQSAPLRINGAVNGQPAIRFDGSSQYLSFDMPVNGMTGMTVFVVSANLSDQTTDPYAVGKCVLFWNETADWGTIAVTPLQRFVGIRFGTGQVNNNTLHTRPATVGTAFTITCNMKSNTVDRVFTNGMLAETWTGRLSTITNCRASANLGRGYNDASFFHGDVAEVIVYERALSGEEKATVEGYLAYKYGVSGPAAHYPPADPTFTPSGNAYPVPSTNVVVQCDPTNALRIWFTGSSVLSTSTPASIVVTNGQTLNSFATNLSAVVGSGVKSTAFTLTNPPIGLVERPTFYPPEGTNLNSVTVSISCATPGATVLYSLDLGDNWSLYSSPLTFTNWTRILARGTNYQWTASENAMAIYTITNAVPTVRRHTAAEGLQFFGLDFR